MSDWSYPDGGLGERDLLDAFLDFERAAVLKKVEGLDLRTATRKLVPSLTTLLGLVKHSGYVERWWFQVAFANEAQPAFGDDDPDGDFRIDPGDTVNGIVEFYKDMCARSREIAAAASLDDMCAFPGMTDKTFRWVMVHMIEETARHAGHADILREQLDGSTGL